MKKQQKNYGGSKYRKTREDWWKKEENLQTLMKLLDIMDTVSIKFSSGNPLRLSMVLNGLMNHGARK